MNLTDFEQTALRTVFEAVKNEAARYSSEIADSEIIGLVPQHALDADAISYLRLENFSATQVFENRLHSAENGLTNDTTENIATARQQPRPK
jgi:glutamate formiminotransferase